MVHLHKLSGFKVKGLVMMLVVALLAAALVSPAPAQAHCDSVNGPVVAAAEKALAQSDVRLILPYVQPESEAELTAAYKQAVEVRKLGGNAQKLAETYFFETAVRLHRVGEGAAYTGLKYESDFGPALTAADKALESGSIQEVNKLMERAVREGITKQFQGVKEAREKAARAGTVEAQRERAEAELMFEKYVLGLYQAATGEMIHGEGEAPAGHEHAVSEPATAAATEHSLPSHGSNPTSTHP